MTLKRSLKGPIAIAAIVVASLPLTASATSLQLPQASGPQTTQHSHTGPSQQTNCPPPQGGGNGGPPPGNGDGGPQQGNRSGGSQPGNGNGGPPPGNGSGGSQPGNGNGGPPPQGNCTPQQQGGGSSLQPQSSSTTRHTGIALPLGDFKASTAPRVGYIYSCPARSTGLGAFVDGPWIDTKNKVWYPQQKLAALGSVRWSQAAHSFTISDGKRVIFTNALPVGETTGTFPIASTDPAYQYDPNPNTISAQSITFAVPVNPTVASTASCLGKGTIGVLTDGVPLYAPFDELGRDAIAHEVQDSCGGHPDASGTYHHHNVASCILAHATGRSTLVGYALDGYGIYVERDAHGKLPTNAALDECHGRTSVVSWDGQNVSMYHYVASAEFPYTIGCYRGTPASVR